MTPIALLIESTKKSWHAYGHMGWHEPDQKLPYHQHYSVFFSQECEFCMWNLTQNKQKWGNKTCFAINFDFVFWLQEITFKFFF